tara:strand:+ start:6122 stop:7735 length:1614 start_codon:yes stop_codon:yes gene_type:complete
MILLATDYSSTAELTAAIDTYLSNAADIYVTKATYDISRGCDQTDFFVNVLHHQAKNGYQDRVQFPGFEDYTVPPPSHTIAYLDGFNTTYGTAPSTYTEGTSLTITVISGNSAVQILNTDITLTFGTEVFTVTANAQGTATFTFTPTTQGSVTVTSALSSAASNAIALGYHGVSVDTSIYSVDSTATYANTLAAGRAVGDAVAGFGAVTVSDVTNALVMSAVSRLLFTKHATVEIGSLFYNPGVGGSLSYTITPVAGDYTFDTSSNFGQSKSLDDLRYNYAVTDSDGSPESTVSNIVTLVDSDLAADGSFTGSIPISADFNNPLLVVFALANAFNKAVITTQNITGLSAAITDKASFEPDNTVVVTFSNDAGEDADVTGSLLYLEGYPTAALTGTPLVTTSGFVTATNTATLSLPIPSTLDQDLFLKTGYTFYNVINSVTVAYIADSTVDVTTVLTVASDVSYYTSGTETITVTVTMEPTEDRTDYELSITAIPTSGSTENIVLSNADNILVYTFTPTTGNLEGTTSIVLNVSVAEA